MEEKPLAVFAARLAESLQRVDLDTAQSFLVSNEQADKLPELQRAMLELLQTERMRRDGTEIEGYPLPAFDQWAPESTLLAGAHLVGVAEVAAMTGEPGIIDLCFRLVQFWLTGLTAGFAAKG